MMNDLADRVLAFIEEHPGCHAREVSKSVFGSNVRTLESIRGLIDSGHVVDRGTGSRSSLHVSDPLQDRKERTEKRRERAANERILTELEQLRERTSLLDAIGRPTLHRPIVVPNDGAEREGCMVVLASDWHIEETVDPESVHGRNAFNLGIAERRVARFFSSALGVLRIYRGASAVRTMVLGLLGDLITGYLHEEQLEGNGCSPVEAVHLLKSWLLDGIRTLLDQGELDRLVIPCVVGNHGRTTNKTRVGTITQNSFEWLLYKTLADEVRDARIEWVIPKSAHAYVEVFGRTLHFHHGDSVNYGGGIGGVTIPLRKAIAGWQSFKRSDIHHIGHFHQYLDIGDCIVNGSLVGYGPYSLRIKAGFESPQQAAYLLDSQRGKCLVTPLWVSEKDQSPVPTKPANQQHHYCRCSP